MTLTENRLRVVATPHVKVLLDRCAGCQECIIRCPTGALSLDVDAWIAVADDLACVGCRQCVRTCPFAAIVVTGPVLVADRSHLETVAPPSIVGDRQETRLGITSWVDALAEAERCLNCPDPTCVRGCPAHNDIPGFVAAIRSGDLDEAHGVIGRTSVLPDICSRVCDQELQCEGACTWSLAGAHPVAIGALERFVTDNAPVPGPVVDSDRGAGLHVAVVGSGPAGLAAAWELAEAGARVSVFEKDFVAGGLLGWGIPEFTLPAEQAGRPAAALAAAGVQFHFGAEIGPAGVDGLLARHDAVVIAVGASQALRLPVPGNNLQGIWDATRFLTEGKGALGRGETLADLGVPPRDGGPPTVLVLGAANTAMDVARTAHRLGGRAVCVDWMDRRFAPVRPDELAEAACEGVDIRFLTTVDRFEGRDGRVTTARLSRTHQRRATELPKVVARDCGRLEVDLVVMAMGYRLDPAMAAESPGVPVRKTMPDLPDRRWVASGIMATPPPSAGRGQPVGALAVGRETARVLAGQPRRDRVWTVGDALIGPSTVVEAMAHGKQAAIAVLDRLGGRG